MIDMLEIQENIKKYFPVRDFEKSLLEKFEQIMKISDAQELMEELECLSQGEKLTFFYAGIQVFVCNSGGRGSFIRARLEIFTETSRRKIAWFELEYNDDGEIIDDYMDFYV